MHGISSDIIITGSSTSAEKLRLVACGIQDNTMRDFLTDTSHLPPGNAFTCESLDIAVQCLIVAYNPNQALFTSLGSTFSMMRPEQGA
jgi:hypothetical protein